MDRKHCCEAPGRADCKCPDWQSRFFENLAETSNVSAAVEHAGISASHAYRLKREDAHFANRWNEALLQGYEALELETLERLRKGVATDERKYDITNALRLLGMHRDSVAKHRALKATKNEEAMIRAINAKISTLRQVERTAARAVDLLPDKRPSKKDKSN